MGAMNPFEKSTVPPDPLEKVVAGLIWQHQRSAPISIDEIVRTCGHSLSDRKVKEIVEQLRVTHRCAIGASRQTPFGYFWVRTADDREAAVKPYREQILSMWRTLRVLDSQEKLRELYGQLRLDQEAES